jgi:hypothetical protein
LKFNDFFRHIRTVLTHEKLSKAIDLTKFASTNFVNNKEKRNWVINELMKVPGIDENTARFLTEAAVRYLKVNEDV